VALEFQAGAATILRLGARSLPSSGASFTRDCGAAFASNEALLRTKPCSPEQENAAQASNLRGVRR